MFLNFINYFRGFAILIIVVGHLFGTVKVFNYANPQLNSIFTKSFFLSSVEELHFLFLFLVFYSIMFFILEGLTLKSFLLISLKMFYLHILLL